MLEIFEGYGVSQNQIEKRIQCRIEAVRPAQIIQLYRILTSLKDGMSKPEDWFEAEPKPVVTNPEKAAAPVGASRTTQLAAELGGKA